MYSCMYVCVPVYDCLCVSMYVCMYYCRSDWMIGCICMCVFMYGMDVCMRIYMYCRMFVYICVLCHDDCIHRYVCVHV